MKEDQKVQENVDLETDLFLERSMIERVMAHTVIKIRKISTIACERVGGSRTGIQLYHQILLSRLRRR